MNRLVVKPHRPGRGPLLVLLAMALLTVAGWGLFEYGRHRAGFDFEELQAELQRFEETTEGLRQTNDRLRKERAVLERTGQIEREASRELDRRVGTLQDEILELKSELAFYRGIVSPHEAAQGLRIQRFEIQRNAMERSYRYKVVLTQVLKNDTVARGTVGLSLEGSLDGERKVLDLKQVSMDDEDKLHFKFKYFQDFEGDVALPEGFIPSRIIVTVDPHGRRYSKIEKKFDWPKEEA